MLNRVASNLAGLAIAVGLFALLCANELAGGLMADSVMALVMTGFCFLPGLVAGLASLPHPGESIIRVAFLSAIAPACFGLGAATWLLLSLTASGPSVPAGVLVMFVVFSALVLGGNLIGSLSGTWIAGLGSGSRTAAGSKRQLSDPSGKVWM